MKKYKAINLFKKKSTNTAPFSIIDNSQSITKPLERANALNKYFVIQSSSKHTKNSFHAFLPPLNINYFFINPTYGIEVKNITMSINHLKAIGLYSILT